MEYPPVVKSFKTNSRLQKQAELYWLFHCEIGTLKNNCASAEEWRDFSVFR